FQRQRVDVAPTVGPADAGRDVRRDQVVVENLAAQRKHDHVPTGQPDRDEQEPGQADGTQVAPGGTVEPAACQPRSARGAGFRGSGPMYSDCGRIMRLWAACSST